MIGDVLDLGALVAVGQDDGVVLAGQLADLGLQRGEGGGVARRRDIDGAGPNATARASAGGRSAAAASAERPAARVELAHPATSSETSSALAECVSAPSETKSTPVSPDLAQVVERDPARSLGLDAAADDRHRLDAARRAHVVEQDAVDAGVERRRTSSSVSASTSRRRRGADCAEPGHGRRDPAGQPQVVVLDEQRLAEVEPVVRPAAAADGVLLQVPQPGRGLARVEQRGAGPVELGDAAGRQRGDAREPAEQVQRGPLAREDGPGRAR